MSSTVVYLKHHNCDLFSRLYRAYLQDGVCLAELSDRMVSSGEFVRVDAVPAP